MRVSTFIGFVIVMLLLSIAFTLHTRSSAKVTTQPAKPVDESQAFIPQLRYTRDTRDGRDICYAYVFRNGAYGYSSLALTYIPCDKAFPE
jgi:hypothetical protein